jgi:S1-C subfamily serine protease
MSNWKVGDMAMCVGNTGAPNINGQIVEVIGPLENLIAHPSLRGFVGHKVDPGFPDPDGIGWAVPPEYLKPIPDANTKGSWDDCVFKPMVMV